MSNIVTIHFERDSAAPSAKDETALPPEADALVTDLARVLGRYAARRRLRQEAARLEASAGHKA